MDERELHELVAVKNRCPQCNGETQQTEKDTSSGREIREYQCQACGWSHFFDGGAALWKILSDARGDELEPPAKSSR